MSEWFRVEVTDRIGQVVSIEPEQLAGRDIAGREMAIIQNAIKHLMGFAGMTWCPSCGPIYEPCEHKQRM